METIDDLQIKEKVESIAGKGTKVLDCEKSTSFQQEEVLLVNGYPVHLKGEEGERIKRALTSGQVPPCELLNDILLRAGIIKNPVELETTMNVKCTTRTTELMTLRDRSGALVDERMKEVEEDNETKSCSREIWRREDEEDIRSIEKAGKSLERMSLKSRFPSGVSDRSGSGQPTSPFSWNSSSSSSNSSTSTSSTSPRYYNVSSPSPPKEQLEKPSETSPIFSYPRRMTPSPIYSTPLSSAFNLNNTYDPKTFSKPISPILKKPDSPRSAPSKTVAILETPYRAPKSPVPEFSPSNTPERCSSPKRPNSYYNLAVKPPLSPPKSPKKTFQTPPPPQPYPQHVNGTPKSSSRIEIQSKAAVVSLPNRNGHETPQTDLILRSRNAKMFSPEQLSQLRMTVDGVPIRIAFETFV